MIGNCRDCRWWTPTIAMGGICRLASWADDVTLDSKAHALGPNGRGPASLVTAPDFGCVQFEIKDAR